jgi:hypothetical protein
MTLDIVLGIGCPVMCKNCPQEVIVKKHRMPPMTLEMFKRYVSTIPNDELLIFAGVSEPFVFPEVVDMIEYAHAKGHPMHLFTTLVGLKPDEAKRLAKIPFVKIVLHLPDAEGNARIPASQNYYESLYILLTTQHNLRVMNMGKNFISDHNEDVLRGQSKIQHNGRVMCPNLGTRAYMLFPDGMVTLCCMLRGMEGVVGNLNTDTYQDLMERYDEIALEYQTNPETMCHRCSVAENYYWYHFKKPISKLMRHPSIIKLRNKYKAFPVVETEFVNQLDGQK